MRVIRGYGLELCWLLLLLVVAAAPIGAQIDHRDYQPPPPLGKDWDDQAFDCGEPPGWCIIIDPW